MAKDLRLDRPRATQLMMEFIEECPRASEDTKRKMRRRLGLA